VAEPIRQGDRGAAVEDVQQRLLALGYDLGPTGVDGVFLGATLAALREFQRAHGISEDGVVGPETWSALVDATFRLGDRLLYVRFPYLHGEDVRTLQGALNALGFACGKPDGIFGPYTERAVREFQANVGLPVDGIAGTDTVRAIERLRHVWQDKDPHAPAALAVAPARAVQVLRRMSLALACEDECARAVGDRVANLALATEPAARVVVCDEMTVAEADIVLHLSCAGGGTAREGVPLVSLASEGPAEGRFLAAFASSGLREAMVVLADAVASDEHAAQAAAVRILDGVCAVLSGEAAAVV
jgi:hypothetical protein